MDQVYKNHSLMAPVEERCIMELQAFTEVLHCSTTQHMSLTQQGGQDDWVY